MALVEVRDATVAFTRSSTQFLALDRVSIAIAPGDRVGIVGGSGSGKTTLARLILGLQAPSTGEVDFKGRSILAVPERSRGWLRSAASMVFQDPNSSLNPRMRVRDIVAEPLRSPLLRARGDVPDPTKAVLESAIAGVGLDPSLLERFPHQLSGGQRQRVAIARSLVAEPELLVADEPVSALDVSVRSQVLNLLQEQVSNRNLALVLISHDLQVVRRLCDQVLVLHQGKVVESGAASSVLEHPNHPYTQALLAATLML